MTSSSTIARPPARNLNFMPVTIRFAWTPRENGIVLFCVGAFAAGVEAGLPGGRYFRSQRA
jgi:hypothetical protein